MTLVNLRCARCQSVLKRIESEPADWTGVLTVRRCDKCYAPSVGRIVDVLIAADVDGIPTAMEMPWSEVRALVGRAKAAQKTLDMKVHDCGNQM